jgi:hypothetical protein
MFTVKPLSPTQKVLHVKLCNAVYVLLTTCAENIFMWVSSCCEVVQWLALLLNINVCVCGSGFDDRPGHWTVMSEACVDFLSYSNTTK